MFWKGLLVNAINLLNISLFQPRRKKIPSTLLVCFLLVFSKTFMEYFRLPTNLQGGMQRNTHCLVLLSSPKPAQMDEKRSH